MPTTLFCRLALLSLTLFAGGCAATTTALGKRDLDVQTRMSDSIFLDPLSPDQRAVFVQVKNTSDQTDLSIEPVVRDLIAAKGYRLVDDPDSARYLLQANVLQAGQASETAVEQAFSSGFGGALLGGAVGALATRAATSDTGAIIGGGLVGAAVEAAAGSLIKDVTYSVITDIQVSERAPDGVVVTETMEQAMVEGSAGSTVLRASKSSDWKRYRTRVVSVANQVNLEFEDASPALVDGLTRSIAGIF
jgi:hypothetical protein